MMKINCNRIGKKKSNNVGTCFTYSYKCMVASIMSSVAMSVIGQCQTSAIL